MNTQLVQKIRLIGAILVIGSGLMAAQSCSKSKVNGKGNSAYSNPDAIPFSKDHLQFMLKQTYNNFYNSPPESARLAIENAADDDAARDAYEEQIEIFVDSGVMAERWKDYAFAALGVGSDAGAANTRYPANLWSKVLLSGDEISEFILADYAVDDTGVEIAQTYTNGPPVDVQAGYITMESFVDLYMNQFQFKMAREVIGFNLCDSAPFTRISLYSWSETEVNPTYTSSGGINCYSCHKNWEPIRGAWQQYTGNNQNYVGNNVQGNNQFDQEAGNGGGATLEPRDTNSAPIPEMDAANYYKLVDGGANLTSPRVLAQEISTHPAYSRCMVERFLSVFLNAEQGHPGQNFVAPNNFSGNEAGVAMLEKWTSKFNELNQVPKKFFKEFLKSSDYIIIGYSPSEE